MHKVYRLLLRKKLITRACENNIKKKKNGNCFVMSFSDVEKVISDGKYVYGIKYDFCASAFQ